MPLISVILPFHKNDNTLRKAIKSIIDQSFKDWELIPVANYKIDKSYDGLVEEFSVDDRISFFPEEKPGVANAFNKGLGKATGTYIARMDSDDISLPDRLEKQVIFLNKEPKIDVVFCRVKYESTVEKDSGYKSYVNWQNSLISPEAMFNSRFRDLPMANPTFLIRRSSLEKFGKPKSGKFPEDYEMWLRWWSLGAQIAKIPESLYIWHDHKDRSTRNLKEYDRRFFDEIKLKFLSKFLTESVSSERKLVCWGYGPKARKKIKALNKQGVFFTDNLEVNSDTIDGKNVFHYQDFKFSKEHFIVSLVSNRGASKKIKSFLGREKNLKEGEDYILTAV